MAIIKTPFDDQIAAEERLLIEDKAQARYREGIVTGLRLGRELFLAWLGKGAGDGIGNHPQPEKPRVHADCEMICQRECDQGYCELLREPRRPERRHPDCEGECQEADEQGRDCLGVCILYSLARRTSPEVKE